MRILILGGNAWLGQLIARHGVDSGHDVTCVVRGTSGEVALGATLVTADRDNDDGLAAVADIRWDAVIDVARQPGHVRRAVRDLRGAARYVFVSSASAYAQQGPLGQGEDAALLTPLAADVMESTADYGAAKVACEEAILTSFGPGRSLIARAGLIGGPGDTSGRTGYWPLRCAFPARADGGVLAPDDLGIPTQIIDVRDVAAWLIRGCEQGTAGIFNATGYSIPLGEHLAQARLAAGHGGRLVLAAGQWLKARNISEWSGPSSLPLWLSDPDWQGMNARSNGRAIARGLSLRPLVDTLRDTLDWEVQQGIDRQREAGLTRAEEAELLAEICGGR